MAGFGQLLADFDADPAKRGKQFEHFVKWFLTVDPEWSSQVAKVWLWDEWPGRWGRDCGVDLVFQHRNGQTWAVQAKCYAAEYEITKSDVDKFLSETNRKAIDHRLLIATTDLIGANAKQVCEAQEKKSVVRYLLSDFEKAAIDYPASLAALATGKRKAPPHPRPYQSEAIENVCKGFETADRGQLLMACGTGKTLVSMWIKERMQADLTLVLVPSLGLLSQIVGDWTSATSMPFDVLCVCSDQTAGKREEDAAITSVADLPFPVTSDLSRIAAFLCGNGRRVVFSTYQSSPLIAEAQCDHAVPSFDLIIADEAHRCAGKVDSAFSAVRDDAKLRARKRLFATATPRTYSSSLQRAAEERGVEVVGMDDEAAFGKPLHTLSFGEAIERNLLTDYRVVIVGVDDAMIAEWIRNRRIVGTNTGIETDAQSFAAQVGMIKAIRDWGLQRIISFHNRVKRAEQFAEEIQDVFQWLDAAHKPDRTIWAEHVSGNMPTNARRQKLRRLKEVQSGEVGIISNARCLSEGVDVPALDGVAFIDPRSSQIDIVQGVGRAIRLSPNKTKGTIVIPVFIEQDDDPEQAILSSNFEPIWQVLDALKSHDDVLSSQLDQFRIELGSGARTGVRSTELTKIEFDLPTSVGPAFADKLRTHLVERTTESWMMWYGMLEAFVEERGQCSVPTNFTSTSGYPLGAWVTRQRAHQERISSERLERLNSLGFVWDARAEAWDEGYRHLERFVEERGHGRVPQGEKSVDGFLLGAWVREQRAQQETMQADRKARLDALGFLWAPWTDAWNNGFGRLVEYSEERGHCVVPDAFTSVDGFRLGQWVCNLRSGGIMVSPDRRAQLDEIGFAWDPIADQWEIGLEQLKNFIRQHNHQLVPQTFRCSDGYRLGLWVSNMRRRKEKLSPERTDRLDALGFVWDPHPERWEIGFRHLVEFEKEFGHSLVPAKHRASDGYTLGSWVSNVRRLKVQTSSDQRARLDALGFVWSVKAKL